MGVALVLLWLALVVGLALAARRRWPGQPEWSRKVLHIGTGPVVLIAWAVAVDRWLALAAAALVTVVAALNHRYRLLPAIEDVGRHSYGTVAYGAAITALLAAVLALPAPGGGGGSAGDGLGGWSGRPAGRLDRLTELADPGPAEVGGGHGRDGRYSLVVLLRLRLLGGAGPGPGALVAISRRPPCWSRSPCSGSTTSPCPWRWACSGACWSSGPEHALAAVTPVVAGAQARHHQAVAGLASQAQLPLADHLGALHPDVKHRG